MFETIILTVEVGCTETPMLLCYLHTYTFFFLATSLGACNPVCQLLTPLDFVNTLWYIGLDYL